MSTYFFYYQLQWVGVFHSWPGRLNVRTYAKFGRTRSLGFGLCFGLGFRLGFELLLRLLDDGWGGGAGNNKARRRGGRGKGRKGGFLELLAILMLSSYYVC